MFAPDALTLRVGRPLGVTVAAATMGVIGGVVATEALDRLGSKFVIAAIGAGIAWWLVSRPTVCVAALVLSVIAFENDPRGAIPETLEWYRGTFGGLTPTDLLIGITFAAILHDHFRTARHLHLPRAFLLPLALIAAGAASGLVTGYSAGADRVLLLNSVRTLTHLLVVPFLAAQVLTSMARVRSAVTIVAVATVAKAVLGLVMVSLGEGRSVGVDVGDAGAVLTYYAPTMNVLTMLVGLTVLALLLTRAPLPNWSRSAAVVSILCLVFSYRRSFWIAIVIAAVLVAMVASGRRGRLVVVLAGVVVAAGVQFALTSGGATTNESAVAKRVRSLDPDTIEATPEDRYRLDEQRNVFEEIKRQPLTGLGFGVPWTAWHPLPEEHPGGRDYTHTTVLWYWLKTGPIGLLGYLTLHATIIWTALQVWRRRVDPLLSCTGLAVAAGTVGLAIAETTGSFTGVEPRLTVVLGALAAWLAAAATLPDESELARDPSREWTVSDH